MFSPSFLHLWDNMPKKVYWIYEATARLYDASSVFASAVSLLKLEITVCYLSYGSHTDTAND